MINIQSQQFQQTISNEISFKGVGLHSGELCELTLFPAPINYGIKFNYQKRDNCAVCDNSSLQEVLNLNEVPLAGYFPTKNQLKKKSTYPLRLLFCNNNYICPLYVMPRFS